MTGAGPLRVLALAPYPVEAAATRLRLVQLKGPLAARGMELTVSPFVSSATFSGLYDRRRLAGTVAGLAAAAVRRMGEVLAAHRFDVVVVQREAMLAGPPVVEWLVATARKVPLVLDLDDPTWVAYDSPTYGRLGRLLKWPAKAGWLIRHSAVVTCGSPVIAEHVRALGTAAVVVPSVVDTDLYRPGRGGRSGPPVVGWVGSHSTWQYLDPLLAVLAEVGREHQFLLRVVGAGVERLQAPGVPVEALPWSLAREVEDFQSLDVGLYPMPEGDAWASGKSGLKAVQYMAVGVPFVASPVGVMAQMGEAGLTHLLASTPGEWRRQLGRLLGDPDLRRRMGQAGRAYSVAHYGLDGVADTMARALRQAAGR